MSKVGVLSQIDKVNCWNIITNTYCCICTCRNKEDQIKCELSAFIWLVVTVVVLMVTDERMSAAWEIGSDRLKNLIQILFREGEHIQSNVLCSSDIRHFIPILPQLWQLASGGRKPTSKQVIYHGDWLRVWLLSGTDRVFLLHVLFTLSAFWNPLTLIVVSTVYYCYSVFYLRP